MRDRRREEDRSKRRTEKDRQTEGCGNIKEGGRNNKYKNMGFTGVWRN